MYTNIHLHPHMCTCSETETEFCKYLCVIFIAKGKVKPYNFFKRRNKHNEEKINVHTHSHTAGFYAVKFCTVDPQPSRDLTPALVSVSPPCLYICC